MWALNQHNTFCRKCIRHTYTFDCSTISHLWPTFFPSHNTLPLSLLPAPWCVHGNCTNFSQNISDTGLPIPIAGVEWGNPIGHALEISFGLWKKYLRFSVHAVQCTTEGERTTWILTCVSECDTCHNHKLPLHHRWGRVLHFDLFTTSRILEGPIHLGRCFSATCRMDILRLAGWTTIASEFCTAPFGINVQNDQRATTEPVGDPFPTNATHITVKDIDFIFAKNGNWTIYPSVEIIRGVTQTEQQSQSIYRNITVSSGTFTLSTDPLISVGQPDWNEISSEITPLQELALE